MFAILALLPLNPPFSSTLQTPFRVQADGRYIDAERCHAAPVFEDIDGDGLRDLLVGQFLEGKIHFYKNEGTPTEPLFKDGGYLHAGGEPISVDCG